MFYELHDRTRKKNRKSKKKKKETKQKIADLNIEYGKGEATWLIIGLIATCAQQLLRISRTRIKTMTQNRPIPPCPPRLSKDTDLSPAFFASIGFNRQAAEYRANG